MKAVQFFLIRFVPVLFLIACNDSTSTKSEKTLEMLPNNCEPTELLISTKSIVELTKFEGEVYVYGNDPKWVISGKVFHSDLPKFKVGNDISIAVHSPIRIFAADQKDLIGETIAVSVEISSEGVVKITNLRAAKEENGKGIGTEPG